MIALQKNTQRILACGLNDAESHSINDIVINDGGEFYTVDSDFDLWNAARTEHFDFCILGQSEELPFPTFRIWLLRGLQPDIRIVVLYDEIGSLETGPLENCQQVQILQRPIDPSAWSSLLESDATIPHVTDSPLYQYTVERPATETIES